MNEQLSYSTVHTVCFMSLLVQLVVSYMSKSDGANDKPAGKVQRLSGNYSINVLTTLNKYMASPVVFSLHGKSAGN